MNNQSDLIKIEDEAAGWIVTLADNSNNHNEQLRQFSAWLNRSELHAQVWAYTCRAYAGLAELPAGTQAQWPQNDAHQHTQDQTTNSIGRHPARLPEVQDELGKMPAIKAPGCRRRLPGHLPGWKKSLPGLAIAACLILVLLLPRLTLHMAADYVSATGEQQTHLLKDGSRLTLAPESAVAIDYSVGQRQVRILKGSAFFEVQRNPQWPFTVQAQNTLTTVLGTAFSVDMNEHGSLVSVARGRVRVEDRSRSPAVSEDLVAGQQLAVIQGQRARLTRIAPHDVARWRQGELVARDLTVSEVVDSFRRYYGGVIVVTEPFAGQRVTGLYRLHDPASTLADMAQAHGATARRISPWLLVLSQ